MRCIHCTQCVNFLDAERKISFMQEELGAYELYIYNDKKKQDTALEYCEKKGLQPVRYSPDENQFGQYVDKNVSTIYLFILNTLFS